MNDPETLDFLQYLIRQLQKLDSKLWAGEEVQAWRHNKSLIAEVERKKDQLLFSMSQKEKDNGE